MLSKEKKIIGVICILLFSFQLDAQNNLIDTGIRKQTDSSTILPIKKHTEKDFIDVLRKWFGYKPSEKADTLQVGDKPVLTILPAIGYTLQTRFAAIISGNTAFFTSKNPDSKLSVVTANVMYTQNQQFTIPVISNVWLHGDEYNLLGDWRFMKYPQSTFGLGSDAPIENEDPMDYDYIRFYQYILKKISTNLYAGLGYNLDYHWGIEESGLANNTVSDYKNYDGLAKSVSSGFSFTAAYDSRRNPINSHGGISANIVFRNNVTWLGSNSNWESLILDIRKYITLPGYSRNVLAFWSYYWVVLKGKPPYLDLPSTGWDDFNNTGRGFIQGRYRGNQMYYLETEYRFRITGNGLLGGVVFANAETFSDTFRNQLEAIQPAAGFGIRLKLNKKSDTNIAIDYGIGTQGSKGVFVNIGEVF